MLSLSGTDTQNPIHYPTQYQTEILKEMTANHEILVGPFEDVVVPMPHDILALVRKRRDYVQT